MRTISLQYLYYVLATLFIAAILYSCSDINFLGPEVIKDPIKEQYIDSRLYGTYSLETPIGYTELHFNGTTKGIIDVFSGYSGSHRQYRVDILTVDDMYITTCTTSTTIEEWGEFNNRPYYVAPNGDLVIYGQNTDQTATKQFRFIKVSNDYGYTN